jgi:hypothetical protein
MDLLGNNPAYQVDAILSAFPESVKQDVPVVATSSLIDPVTVYTWPTSATPRQKKAVLAFMVRCGRSESQDVGEWQVWLLTYQVLCFPELGEMIRAKKSPEYVVDDLPQSFVDDCYKGVETMIESQDPDQRITIPYPKGMIQGQAHPFGHADLACMDNHALYMYAALQVFLCGKQMDNRNRTAITEKRPRALIGQFPIPDHASWILTGEGRMSDNAHKYVNSAWSVAEVPRILIMTHYATVRTGDMNVPQRIINNIMSLLEYSGMHAIPQITRLIKAHPWVIRMPGLTAAFMTYADNIKLVSGMKPHLQRYVKLIYGNASSIIRRREYAPLTAVAVFWARQLNPTIKLFRVEEGNSAVVEQFTAECDVRGIKVNQVTDQAVAELAQ